MRLRVLLLLLPVLELDELLEDFRLEDPLEDFRLEDFPLEDPLEFLSDPLLEFLSDPLPMWESLERLEFSAPVIASPAML